MPGTEATVENIQTPKTLPSPAYTAGVYLECIDDDSLTNFQFNGTGGTGKATYLAPYSPGDLQPIVQDVLGYTRTAASSGAADLGNATRCRLARSIPVTHPHCPYLYAANISSFVGKGSATANMQTPIPPRDALIGVKPIANYFRYRQYEIGVDFASRPYPVLTDGVIGDDQTTTWYAKQGNSATWKYSPEWLRYCTYDYTQVTDNQIQGLSGQFKLLISPTRDATFNSPPWMWLPDQLLTVRWYQVPYRYVTSSNSYVAPGPKRNWRGRVNQNPWWNWAAGSLLYLGFSVARYCPPTLYAENYPTYTGTLDRTTGLQTKTVLKQVPVYERLCDIELTFLHTARFMSSVLDGPVDVNKNYVPAGHNLQPNLADNKFYYATRDVAAGTPQRLGVPSWFSFPAEMLFSDPDAAQTDADTIATADN